MSLRIQLSRSKEDPGQYAVYTNLTISNTNYLDSKHFYLITFLKEH